MPDDLWIIGISMTKFMRYDDKDLIDLASEAALAALDDAGVTISDIGVLAAGCLYEASAGVGQRLQKQIGQTGIGVYNVANACATGATAFRVAAMAVKAGEADIGLAVGVEQMGKRGLLGTTAPADRDKPFRPSGRYGAVGPIDGVLGTSLMPGTFAQSGMEYAYLHDGVGFEQFARVAEKNHAHSTLNPLAQYQKAFSLEQVMSSEMIAYPNTLLMCCPTGDGAAAAVVTSSEKLKAMPGHVRRRAVKVSASVMTSDPYVPGGTVQYDVNRLTRRAADLAYEAAGVAPSDLDLVELHDCFATAACATTTTSGSARRAAPGSGSTSAARGGTARYRSTSPAACCPRATRSAPPGSPTSTRSAPSFAARPGTGRSTAPRSG